MADYRVGMIRNPTVPLAVAVAAPSAFPPVLSPLTLEVDPTSFDPAEKGELHEPPFTTEVVLTDGGVYDNLGPETAWKRCRTVLVSDGGGQMWPEAEPKTDWARHALRITGLMDNQVRALRKRQVVVDQLGICDLRHGDAEVGAVGCTTARGRPVPRRGPRVAQTDVL